MCFDEKKVFWKDSKFIHIATICSSAFLELNIIMH